jgi:hypothetical protein
MAKFCKICNQFKGGIKTCKICSLPVCGDCRVTDNICKDCYLTTNSAKIIEEYDNDKIKSICIN